MHTCISGDLIRQDVSDCELQNSPRCYFRPIAKRPSDDGSRLRSSAFPGLGEALRSASRSIFS
jgi:hypothetical protein